MRASSQSSRSCSPSFVCRSVMGYEDLSVVDPTAGEAKGAQEAALSEVGLLPLPARPPPAADGWPA